MKIRQSLLTFVTRSSLPKQGIAYEPHSAEACLSSGDGDDPQSINSQVLMNN